MFKKICIYFLILAGFSACVPNSRLVYFQHEHEANKKSISTDESISRSYALKSEEYKIKSKDILSIRVASITPSEFDFVHKYEEQLGLIRSLKQYEQSNMAGAINQQFMGRNFASEDGINPVMLDRMQTGFMLDAEGMLELPYIGMVKLAGLSLMEAEKLLKEKFIGFFETPVVRVQLLNFHFTILGEVNSEGRYTIFDPNANIIDAISLAGNLNDFADRSRIKIVRQREGVAEVFYVNLLNEDLLSQRRFYLQPNDIIIVPPLPARASRKYTLPTTTAGLSLITSLTSLILVIISLNR
ncbi:MAG TPA: polysaccharide biosynthesis/export family protein [Cyclobacteriaceae bacterium]|nr:polysaccharide biosynthesis/export family protein [Cyclobacteriaceae bacterium]